MAKWPLPRHWKHRPSMLAVGGIRAVFGLWSNRCFCCHLSPACPHQYPSARPARRIVPHIPSSAANRGAGRPPSPCGPLVQGEGGGGGGEPPPPIVWGRAQEEHPLPHSTGRSPPSTRWRHYASVERGGC